MSQRPITGAGCPSALAATAASQTSPATANVRPNALLTIPAPPDVTPYAAIPAGAKSTRLEEPRSLQGLYGVTARLSGAAVWTRPSPDSVGRAEDQGSKLPAHSTTQRFPSRLSA